MLNNHSFAGRLLVAMPHVTEACFNQTVIYICTHNAQGATGIIINKHLTGLSFRDLLTQVDITMNHTCADRSIFYGGPVENRRGLVLHTLDYQLETTDSIQSHLGVTSTLEILKALGKGEGPEKALIALGYASWQAGQLEGEVNNNSWIIIEATDYLIFETDVESKWKTALASIGVNPVYLSLDLGHA